MKKLVCVLLMLAMLCGGVVAMAECAHANATYTGKGYQEQLTLVGHGDGTHTRTFKVFWNYSCGDCGETFSKYIEDGEEHEGCVYKGNGVTCDICKLCNDHEFVDGVCKTCGYECDHADSTKSDHGTWVNAVYTDLGNTVGHHAKYDYAELYDCNTCGARYEVIIDRGREDDEPHEWVIRPEANLDSCGFCGAKKPCDVHEFNDKGICTVCKYGCDHTNSTKGDYVKWLNAVYTNKDETNHHAVYDAAEFYTCNDCDHVEYVILEEDCEEDEWHEWLIRPDAGLTSCTMCGAKKPCDTHKKGSTVSTTNSTKSYTSTAAGHVASYTSTTVYKCSECNWEFTETKTVTEGQANHTFSGSTCTVCGYTCSAHNYVDGVCSVCGNTCTHANAAHNGEGTSKLTSFVDHRDGTHTREFEVWHNYECPTCKVVFEKYIEMGTETEPHEYGKEGTCHVCGAKPACATHTKSSVAKETDGEKNYKSENATQHYAVFDRTTLYNCDVCGWQFSETLKMETEMEDHTFDEGVCSVCGHVCAHAYEEGVMFCTYCKMQAPTKIEETTVEKALEVLPEESKEALAEAGFETAEQIVEELTATAVKQGFDEEQVQVVDVTLQVQVTNAATGEEEWVEVTPENFPDEGLEVTFDPPAGTNVNDYNFVVVHMFTSPDKAGQVEVLTPTVRGGKLVVKFSALSPVSISWKAKPQAVATLPQTGDDSMLLMWVALLAISCTALFMKKRSRA